MIKEVSVEYINQVIENRDDYLGELLYSFDNGIYIACDNTNGNAWVEEFTSKEEAINWLKNNWGN